MNASGSGYSLVLGVGSRAASRADGSAGRGCVACESG